MSRELMTKAMAGRDPALAGIGLFPRAGGNVPFEIGWPEYERDTAWARRLLDVWGVGPSQHAVLTVRNSESPWFGPVVRAMREIGVVYSNAEPYAWDSRRVGALLSLLPVEAIVGLPGETAESLLADDGTAAKLADMPVIWARRDALEPLRGAGLRPAEMAMLGPALGLSCPEGTGLHLDPEEWRVNAVSGRPTLTVAGDRRYRGRDIELDIDGVIDRAPCACGLPGDRVRTR
ncbi:hypothetical protein NLM24_19155 [Nocardia zapadnayensis]|uniref:hypothetical protein n=1 Tax=Nocardia rhamnosiphila TaxID=426716 RepID=UPI002245A5A1|nr:hypothetical protein [Nocardia zapadnayensis]MCX0272785.1 hypothetical protein [Nocardia zapadnayensis]